MKGDPGELDPAAVFKVLNRHSVKYIVIGGIGNTLHGSPYPTYDLDITPATDKRNLSALAAALTDLEAREWDPRKEEATDREWTAEMLRIDAMWILDTKFGRLDVVLEPAGTGGFSDLSRRVVVYELDGQDVPVAHLEDIIRSKEAAGRERDLAQLPTLRKLLERFDPS